MKRIRLYNDYTRRWRQRFSALADHLMEAEGVRRGQFTAIASEGSDLDGTERLARTAPGKFTYWRTYLAVSTSPESGVHRRLKRVLQFPRKVGSLDLERIVFTLGTEVPRLCMAKATETAYQLGASEIRFEIWEPKDIRRRIRSEFGISCPAVHAGHLQQVLRHITGEPRTDEDEPGSESNDTSEPLGRLFISHASEDESFVDRLVGALNPYLAKIWYDKHQILVGDSIVGRINEGFEEADYFAVVLSSASVSKPWVQSEVAAGIMRLHSEVGFRILPILKEDCRIPPLLSHLRYADFTEHFTIGLNQLLQAIQGMRELVEGRAG